ncbi:unnamed protein product [Ostreobium quekettii]|uniref:Fungal lipase-type domain-containing protein n=1 Tax=Ostreobium quekettii TaxID=121088 RepID=A0A8S1IY25_9CHLO|nr:unnamed protein product [Ostreobium quekettii]
MSGATKPHHVVDQNGVVLGYSHFGMLAAARWILKEASPMIKDAMEANPGYALRITGHSMGGGAAAMLTMMIREQHPEFGDVECTVFACPGCMTLEIAKSCSAYVTSYIYGTDLVPTMSPGSLDQLKEEVAASSWASAFQRDMRSSRVVQAVEGSIRGVVHMASSWTSRSWESASWGVRSCYAARCTGPRHKPDQTGGQGDEGQALWDGPSSGENPPNNCAGQFTSGDQPAQAPEQPNQSIQEAATASATTNDASRAGLVHLSSLTATSSCDDGDCLDTASPMKIENCSAAMADVNQGCDDPPDLGNSERYGIAEGAATEQAAQSTTTYQYLSSGVSRFGDRLQKTGGMVARYSSSLWTSVLAPQRASKDPMLQSAAEEGASSVPLLDGGKGTSPEGSSFAEVENLDTGDEMEPAEEEGVFDGRTIQGTESQDASASSGSIADMQSRRQLYPAGRLLHLVPAYILNAESRSDEECGELGEGVLREMGACLAGGNIDHGRFGAATSGVNGATASSSGQHWARGGGKDHCELPVSVLTNSDGDEVAEEQNRSEGDLNGGHGDPGTSEEGPEEEGGEHVLFLDVPQESYGRMRMCRSMLMDHFVPRYMAAFESMIQRLNRASSDG